MKDCLSVSSSPPTVHFCHKFPISTLRIRKHDFAKLRNFFFLFSSSNPLIASSIDLKYEMRSDSPCA